MNDSYKSRQPTNVRVLADDVVACISDLLRLRSVRKESARMFHDSRLMRWLATEARAVARDGIEPDPWSAREVDALAERIRIGVVADRSGVRQLSGRPACVSRSEIEVQYGAKPGQVVGQPVPWVQLAPAAGIGRELWDEECDTWIPLPDDLPRGDYVALNVSGESMEPLLYDTDVVLVNRLAAPRPGDIVLARTDDGYVVKRLAQVSPEGVDLESLNPDFDPINVRDDPNPIAGVVVLRWRDHESHPPTNRVR